MSYILVTIVRNEITNIGNLIKSVKNQSLKPKFWLIFDDQSNDGTKEILLNLNAEWITVEEAKEYAERSLLNYSNILSQCFEIIEKLVSSKNISWEYIAVVDGDVILENKYFDHLTQYLKKHKNVGIVSGKLIDSTFNKEIYQRNELPWGAANLYRKECLKDIGGFASAPSHNSVENVLANIKGWKTKILSTTEFFHQRDMGAKKGYFAGYHAMGGAAKWLGITLTYALTKSIYLTFKIHPAAGIGYLVGFSEASEKKCDNKSVTNFYREKAIFSNIFRKIILRK